MKNNVRLPVVFCLLVDFPDNNIDCSISSDGSHNQVCFECVRPGKFLTGDILEDHDSPGHAICIILWVFTLLIGSFGACTNCLIIAVIQKHKEMRAFDFLLTVLATFDLISSVMAATFSTSIIVYAEGLSQGPFTLVFYYVPFLICMIARSGSVYMTILITAERYVVLAFPIKCSTWFSPLRTKLIALAVGVFAVIMNIPRFTSVTISYNDQGQDVPSLRNLAYIIKATELEGLWYGTLGASHNAIDIWLPLPLLILFNVLLFIEIKKFTKKRRELNKSLKRDIRAARMFVPVVVVLFICNLEPIIHYIVLYVKRIYYRELVFGMALSVVLNASANLPIYYARGPSFRGDIRKAISSWLGKNNVRDKRHQDDGTTMELSAMTGRHKNENSSS